MVYYSLTTRSCLVGARRALESVKSRPRFPRYGPAKRKEGKQHQLAHSPPPVPHSSPTGGLAGASGDLEIEHLPSFTNEETDAQIGEITGPLAHGL